MKKPAYLILVSLAVVACNKSEPSPFPSFNDAKNIVIDGQKISARQYLETYCLGKPGGADNAHCKAATEQNTRDFLTPSRTPQSKTNPDGSLR